MPYGRTNLELPWASTMSFCSVAGKLQRLREWALMCMSCPPAAHPRPAGGPDRPRTGPSVRLFTPAFRFVRPSAAPPAGPSVRPRLSWVSVGGPRTVRGPFRALFHGRGQGRTENIADRGIMTIQQRFGRDLAWGCDQREPQLGEHQRYGQIQRKEPDLVAQRVKDQAATSHP